MEAINTATILKRLVQFYFYLLVVQISSQNYDLCTNQYNIFENIPGLSLNRKQRLARPISHQFDLYCSSCRSLCALDGCISPDPLITVTRLSVAQL